MATLSEHRSPEASPPAPAAPTGPPPPAPRSEDRAGAPLWAVLAFTLVNSLGTGAITNGMYFLTDSAFAFSQRKQYILGVSFGVAYIFGALVTGRTLALVLARATWLSARAILLVLMGVLAIASSLPALVALATDAPAPEWSLWTAALIYGPFSGALWPIVESYLAGGRKGASLRRATGHFNVFWSAALVLAFFGMAPLRSIGRPLDTLTALAAIPLAAAVLLVWFRRTPAPHIEGAHDPRPPVFDDLLIVFRWLLPTSYVVLATLTPFLPGALKRIGLPDGWAMIAAATWMAARVGAFAVFQRWEGWHGRWWVPVAGLLGVLAGFAACILAPLVGAAGLPTMLLGLAVFGASQGMIYLGALYYAMEVVDDGAEAGGMHEALIGVGYTVGPAFGLAVGLAVGEENASFEPILLVGVMLLSCGLCALAGREIHARSRPA
ncbi:MAG: hypothetical protein CMJ31_04785 [Phycisphaerae bacterium]|nr:hypothetical protein [Phycisphaerae bacterium]